MESLKQAKSQLVAALEMEKAKAETVQEELDRYKMYLNAPAATFIVIVYNYVVATNVLSIVACR